MKKKVIKWVSLFLGLVFLTGIFFLSSYLATVRGGIKISVDTQKKYQTMRGFGASSAWTFQELGVLADDKTQADAVEMLYGDTGLRLSAFRYNIGGGSDEPQFDHVLPYAADWFQAARRGSSFFVAENYINDDSFAIADNYDFDRDAGVTRLLQLALATGNVREMVFFANSPHYLMTESDKTTGDFVYQNNLRPDAYEAFSDYLLTITKGLYDRYLADLDAPPAVYISPVNEPQWKWGGDDASQEGCHFDPAELAAFYDVFYRKLTAFNAANGTHFLPDFFESGNYYLKNVRDYLKEMSRYDYFEQITHISVHSYGANAKTRVKNRFARFLKKNYPHLSVSMSEICEMEHGRFDTWDSGRFTAEVILRDITLLNATDWSWWLAVSDGDYNDGLVYWDYDTAADGTRTNHTLSVLKRYYTMGQFSRYIEAGDVRIDIKTSDFIHFADIELCAFQKPDGRIVVVMINDGKTRDFVLPYGYKAEIPTWNAALPTAALSADGTRITVPADTVTTVLLS